MEKPSIISGALMLSAVAVGHTACDGISADEFVKHWDTYYCDKNEGAKIEKKDICIDTYGRRTIADTLSEETRQKLLKIEAQFVNAKHLPQNIKNEPLKDIIKARNDIIGPGKGIYWHTGQKCPAVSCYTLCYDTENGCKIILAKNGIFIP